MNPKCLAIAMAAALAAAAHAAPTGTRSDYPGIRALRGDDLVFAQLSDAIEHFRASSTKVGYDPREDLSFYSYALPREATVFEIAAAFSLPYDTIATLNRLEGSEPLPAGTTLIIPSEIGIFACDRPKTDLEFLMRSLRTSDSPTGFSVRVDLGNGIVPFTFYPGAEFHASERTFFLVAGFRYPLPKGTVTSGFGSRVDPFTGRTITFHTGIDIGAPYGTQVFAARSGKVESTGYSEVYGNYVLLSHDSGWETLYGHMSKIMVSAGGKVASGDTIGLVGSTGMSTGPHLHFETRRRGVATDPAPLILPRR
jgi:murein DD-endopeptidase MepM/ murein hydrolase activator NlpD